MVLKHIFRGAGAYSHYIPAIIRSMVSKEKFLAPYIPYRAEVSQGILQSILEYQTMLYELTDMGVSNTSVYDGTTATAGAAAMCRDRKRSRMYLPVTTHSQVIEVVKTYRSGSGAQAAMVPKGDGVTDADALGELSDDTVSCFYIQQPDCYGSLEECGLLGEIAREKKARYIIGCNPTSLAPLPTPMECGTDIMVGNGQPLGMPLCFGGPYSGFMTTTSTVGRKLSGRIVGETRDVGGERAYVLTLRTREQHTRREKVSSSVCSNQALCALAASVYMAVMGGEGLKEIAVLYTPKAHYLKEQLEQAGLTTRYSREFFHKFVTEGGADSGFTLRALKEKGILGGLPLNDREILRCATEQNRKEGTDQAAQVVKEVCGG